MIVRIQALIATHSLLVSPPAEVLMRHFILRCHGSLAAHQVVQSSGLLS